MHATSPFPPRSPPLTPLTTHLTWLPMFVDFNCCFVDWINGLDDVADVKVVVVVSNMSCCLCKRCSLAVACQHESCEPYVSPNSKHHRIRECPHHYVRCNILHNIDGERHSKQATTYGSTVVCCHKVFVVLQCVPRALNLTLKISATHRIKYMPGFGQVGTSTSSKPYKYMRASKRTQNRWESWRAATSI